MGFNRICNAASYRPGSARRTNPQLQRHARGRSVEKQACGSTYCPLMGTCCREHDICCLAEATCCGAGDTSACCRTGVECCNGTGCDEGTVCCNDVCQAREVKCGPPSLAISLQAQGTSPRQRHLRRECYDMFSQKGWLHKTCIQALCISFLFTSAPWMT